MASDRFQPLQGMSDIAAPEVYVWQGLETEARRVLHSYGFDEVRTPVLERTAVFQRSLGDDTDVVRKEMYSFQDRGGRDVTLRPEGTASIVRFVASAGLTPAARVYYLGPMFRSERPQAGRKRQFHQLGAESMGPANPAADAEMIALQLHLLQAWGLDGCVLEINTRGEPEDRGRVAEALRAALVPRQEELCEDCQRRLQENVLRILDCKRSGCGAVVEALPPITDAMSDASRAYFREVLDLLDRLGIAYRENPRLVRGLDYYQHTVWEITHNALGAQDALAGGGRYHVDMDGAAVDGVGFAMGLERVLGALQAGTGEPPSAYRPPDVWLISLGREAFIENLLLCQTLRRRGVSCGMDLAGRSMKAQMRAANRAGATRAVIRGEREVEEGTFVLKEMAAGTQETLEMPELLNRVLALHTCPPGTVEPTL